MNACFVCDSETLIKSIPYDAFGGYIDNIEFINRIGLKTAQLSKKILYAPSEVIDIICLKFSHAQAIKVALLSFIEVDYTTKGLNYDEKDAIIELVKILGESIGVFVVTEDKTLMQRVVDLNSPLIQHINPRAACSILK